MEDSYKIQVNNRFAEVVEYLVSNGIVGSKKQLAESINISNTKLSEILNNRMMAGISEFQNLSTKYGISYQFILDGVPDDYLVHFDVNQNVHLNPNVHPKSVHDRKTIESNTIPNVHSNIAHEPQPNYVAAAITISSILEQIKILCNCSTDNELAEFFGVKQVTISAWRVRNTINYELLINICAKYGWSLDILFGLKPSPVQSNQTNKDLIIAKLTGQVELLKELLAKK